MVVGVLAAATLVLVGCGQAEDARRLIVDGMSGDEGATTVLNEADRPNPTLAETATLKKVDASTLADANQPGYFTFMTDNGRTCIFDEDEVMCTGTAPADAPAIPPFDEPNAAAVYPEGAKYAIFEGLSIDPGELRAGEYVEHGRVRCSHDDADTVSCSVGDSGFTLTGPDGDITLEGAIIDDSGGNSGSGSRGSSDDTRGSSGSGSSGYITGVSTGSGTVRASSPSCDSRGILIVESVVVQSGVSTEKAIANALAKYPGSEFTTPGACPSLRAQLDGADIYAVYVDYGNDTSGLCSAAASTSGNARVLSNRNEYVSPC